MPQPLTILTCDCHTLSILRHSTHYHAHSLLTIARHQIEPSGVMPKEAARTAGATYSTMNVLALFTLAGALEHLSGTTSSLCVPQNKTNKKRTQTQTLIRARARTH